MVLLITLGGAQFTIQPGDAGPLIQSMSSIQLVQSHGYGEATRYTAVTGEKSITIADESQFAPPAPLVEELRKEVASHQNRWVTYYNEAEKLKKKLAAVKADLETRKVEMNADLLDPAK